MDVRRIITCMVITVVLLASTVALVAAQEPGTDDESGALDPMSLGLQAEEIPLWFDTMMYQLAEGTTFEDVVAAYEAAMHSAGWEPDQDAAPLSESGINALSWTNGDMGFIVMYVPSSAGNPPQLFLLLAGPPVDEEATAEETVSTEESAAEAVPDCPCCKSLAAGTGGLWFENFMGDAAHYDITGPETTTVAVPPKQGETSGCAFVQLKAGTYHIQGKTDWGGQVDFDIEVEAGMISQIPILVEGT